MNYLERLKVIHGLTDKEMSRLFGVSFETLRNWKHTRGRSRPTSATFRLIAVLATIERDAPDLHAALIAQARERPLIITTYNVRR